MDCFLFSSPRAFTPWSFRAASSNAPVDPVELFSQAVHKGFRLFGQALGGLVFFFGLPLGSGRFFFLSPFFLQGLKLIFVLSSGLFLGPLFSQSLELIFLFGGSLDLFPGLCFGLRFCIRFSLYFAWLRPLPCLPLPSWLLPLLWPWPPPRLWLWHPVPLWFPQPWA